MITIHDVAKLAGVSIATVSNVINHSKPVTPKTEEKVQKAIEDLHYIPNTLAKSLKTNKNNVIGILAEDVSGIFSGDIIDGICEYCESNDYAINLCNLRVNRKVNHETAFLYRELEDSAAFKKSVESSLNLFMTSRVSGLIYIGTHPRNVGHILPNLDIPVIYTYAYTQNHDYCINYDDYQGARLAVDYLIGNGHKNIGLICGSPDSVPTQKRLAGYTASLKDHGLSLNPDYIRTGNWHYEDGYKQCIQLQKSDTPPTAIFAMSDLMAYGAIKACIDQGLQIPGDISIHGFDNLNLSGYTTPALTTVSLPLRELGIVCAETMLHLLNHEEPSERSILIACTHIIRQTVLGI